MNELLPTPGSPEWARENVAEAHRLMLATLELVLIRRAELEAKVARIQCALFLGDASVLREGDVPMAGDDAE